MFLAGGEGEVGDMHKFKERPDDISRCGEC